MPVLPGLDALSHNTETLARLRNARLGLLTNPTGVTRAGVAALDVLRALSLNVAALFSPEHGPRADREGAIESTHLDGLPLHSLYGATRRPTAQMLAGLDAVVFDLQDVGARFYTYASTLFYLIEECAPRGIAVIVLDRPNPLGGACQGPITEADLMSFVGAAALPVVHGLTLGELARWFVAQSQLEIELHIVQIEGWHRSTRWPQTGLEWRRPSPNLPDFEAAAWYPGLCLLEFCDFCVGRGTPAPFRMVAAPALDAARFVALWPQSEMAVRAVEIVPAHAKFAGQNCRGVQFVGAAPASPVEFGLRVIATLRASQLAWSREDFDRAAPLVGSRAALDLLWNGDLEATLALARAGGRQWQRERAEFSIYPE